ncbi:MAG: TIGR03790 family protein [Planctomycetota bacterium]
MSRPLFAGAVVTLALALPGAARAGVTPDEVLVVVNDSSTISTAIGSYYASMRSIPALNVFHLPAGTTTAELITRTDYNQQIRDPLIEYLTVTQPQLEAQIKFIVLTKGVPHGVLNSGGSGGSQSAAAVDSELTQLFTGNVPDSGQMGRVDNPYYDLPMPYDVFSSPDVSYLVFRLDGYQTDIDPETGVPADIKDLIDAAQSPATAGQFVLDATSTSNSGDNWMNYAAQDLAEMGLPYTHDTDPAVFLKNQPDIIGYCSWGSNDPSDAGPPYYGEVPPGSGNFYPGTFLPGAISTDYVSTSARSFLYPPSYGQSLIADLIHLGVAGANGHVFEPYLDAVSRPQILFTRYVEGFLAGEAFYQSIPYLSWENVIVCDPLMTSGVAGAIPPKLYSALPSSGIYLGGTRLRAEGADFTTAYDTVLYVNDVPCTDIEVPGHDRVNGTTPPGKTGPAVVKVTTPFGSASKEGIFVYYPALTLSGTVDLGQPVVLSIWGGLLEDYLVFLSFGSGSYPIPPFGDLELDPSQGFTLLFGGSILVGKDDVPGTIPNDPSLSGLTFYLQALVGADIQHKIAHFSNLLTIAIP